MQKANRLMQLKNGTGQKNQGTRHKSTEQRNLLVVTPCACLGGFLHWDPMQKSG